jgi:membrane-associated phospholipid phosphatase
MPVALILAIALLVLLVVGGLRQRAEHPERPADPARQIGRTGRRLYTRRNFLKLAGATAGGAALTYSGVDEMFDEWHRNHVRGDSSDGVSHLAKEFGENYIAFAALAYGLADWALPGTAIGRWGRQCFTATACGLPVLWTWQRALGGSRPSDEKPWGPRYRPLTDENSVSGHTFLAAVPFLVAAREIKHPIASAGMRALSPVTGWSRINDERHYLSQVLLGYGLAWEAVRAADVSPAESSPEAPTTTG